MSFEFNKGGDSVLNITPLPASSAGGSFPGADISGASDVLMKQRDVRDPLHGVLGILAAFLGDLHGCLREAVNNESVNY